MQKKLVALAVAGVLITPLAAQAAVEVYGIASVSADFNKNDDTTAGNSDTSFSVSSNSSRLGFRGDDDLGGGMKAMWQIESGVNFDDGKNTPTTLASRDTYVGLAGGFGTVMAGYLSTPYKTSTGSLDPFADTKGDYNGIMGSVSGTSGLFDVRAPNVLAYMSPDIAGLQLAGAYIASLTNDNLQQTQAQADATGLSLSATYGQGPLMGAFAYELHSEAAGAAERSAWKVGGSYNLGQGTKINAAFENIDVGGTGATAAGDRNAIYVSASHKMGDTTLKAALGKADKNKLSSTGATELVLGVSQNLSKATEVYALFAMVNNDSSAKYGVVSGSGTVVGAPTGKDPSSVSVGIKHSFSSK